MAIWGEGHRRTAKDDGGNRNSGTAESGRDCVKAKIASGFVQEQAIKSHQNAFSLHRYGAAETEDCGPITFLHSLGQEQTLFIE